MDSCFYNLEDEVIEAERRAARMHLRRLVNATNDIIEINDVVKVTAKTREAEDLDVLDTVIETQQLLQKNVLMHFGKDPEPSESNGQFPKLSKRMAKKSSSKSSSSSASNKSKASFR